MKFKCSNCKNCPYCYNCEFCTLVSEYVDDMDYCPQGEQFEEEKDYFISNNGDKIYYDELHIVNKY